MVWFMKLKEVTNTNLKFLDSNESKCYFDKDRFYKIFKSNIDVEPRIEVIKTFLNNNIQGCPQLYEFIYDCDKVVGYSMEYYKKAISFSGKMRFEFVKKKCLELLYLYMQLKNRYDLCYVDFYNGNVCIYNSSILLLDVDSCLIGKNINENITDKYLLDYILSIIYNLSFFDCEVYFTQEERKAIRDELYKNNDDTIKTVKDIERFVSTVAKSDVKKVLKRIPYNIKNH